MNFFVVLVFYLCHEFVALLEYESNSGCSLCVISILDSRLLQSIFILINL